MRSARQSFAVIAAAALVAVLACDDSTAPSGGQDRTFDWSGTIAPGNSLEIKGIIGGIQAMPATGAEVQVSATLRGEESDPSSVDVEVLQHANGVTICAVYPDVPGQPANTCGPGDGGHMSVRDNDVEVTFTVRVPTGVDLVAKTITGGVTAEAMRSDIFARTITGGITVTTSELATASTVTGSIAATIGSTDWDRDLAFMTVTGSVDVALDAACSAMVRLSTVNGTIATDFVPPEIAPGVREGPIGSGGRQLTLSTVTGSVALRRAS